MWLSTLYIYIIFNDNYSPVPNRRRATLIVLFTFCLTATVNRDLLYTFTYWTLIKH